jgi:predicted GNAT family acetyltransferase
MLRTSERRDFKRCPQRWWWGWREGLRLKGEATESDALWFGTGIHLALAEWYCGPGLKRGPHPAETWAEYAGGQLRYIKTVAQEKGLTSGADEMTVERFVEAQALGTAMCEGYVEKYGKDDSWHVIQPEVPFQIDIPDPWASRPTVLGTYCGTYDGVYRDLLDDSLWLMEHKTAKAIFTNHLSLDDQAGSYWAVAAQTLAGQGKIARGEVLTGIMYNFLRKGAPDNRPRDAEGYATNKPTKEHFISALAECGVISIRGKGIAKHSLATLVEEAEREGITVLGERSKAQPPQLFERVPVYRTRAERRTQIQRIQRELDTMNAYRRGELELIKNPTRDCSWDCKFFDMCGLHEQGGDWKQFKKAVFKQQDPYTDHRKSAEES